MRLAIAVAAGLAFAPAAGFAQSAPAETSSTPATDAVGPRELQNFSLQGTVTREADTPREAPATPRPAARAPAPAADRPASVASTDRERTAVPTDRGSARGAAPARVASATPVAERQRSVPTEAPSLSSLTVKLPPAGSSSEVTPASAPAVEDDAGLSDVSGEHRVALWPWLLAAVALGAGGAFLFFRRNGQHALAGGPRIDAFAAPDPEPAPRPAPRATTPRPAPPKAPEPIPAPAPPRPASDGIVSTRLRPWVDINFHPERCIIGDDKVRFDFAVELLNSGSGTATDILVEGRLINASAEQDQVVAAFFANPSEQGERIPSLNPMQRLTVTPQIIVPREQLRMLEAGGRQFFVPLIAFNVIYRWGKGSGQTSAAYLLGRDSKGEKMAPFRVDLGARVFRSLASRSLPIAVRS